MLGTEQKDTAYRKNKQDPEEETANKSQIGTEIEEKSKGKI